MGQYASLIREIGRGSRGARDLSTGDAYDLYGAMLQGVVPDCELGAVLIALRMKGESVVEMTAFLKAVHQHSVSLPRFGSVGRPVVIPSYNGARKLPNLTPLLALLLQRLGLAVVVHTAAEPYGRVTSEEVFSALQVMPVANVSELQMRLDKGSVALVPISILAPGLARLLSMRTRLGVRNSAHSLVKMFDPFCGEGVLLGAATHPPYVEIMREILLAQNMRGLLLRATEGEPFAHPKRRPCMQFIHDQCCEVLFDVAHYDSKQWLDLPECADASVTAAWIKRVLDGLVAIPSSIVDQVSACLYACGFAHSLDAAKDLVCLRFKEARKV